MRSKQELEVEQEYFEDFQLKNPREIQLIGLKHINLKEASDKIANTILEFVKQQTKPVAFKKMQKLLF